MRERLWERDEEVKLLHVQQKEGGFERRERRNFCVG